MLLHEVPAMHSVPPGIFYELQSIPGDSDLFLESMGL